MQSTEQCSGHAPSRVNPLAQSAISSRLNRSNGTENTPELLSLRRMLGGDGGLEDVGVAIVFAGAAGEDNVEGAQWSKRKGREDASATRPRVATVTTPPIRKFGLAKQQRRATAIGLAP